MLDGLLVRSSDSPKSSHQHEKASDFNLTNTRLCCFYTILYIKLTRSRCFSFSKHRSSFTLNEKYKNSMNISN